ncbi:glutathione-dependent formaldehyde-activating enzyme [Stagonosporopsis vannaccii]|nr:glutathione-dependent formaldehyde-activating enzyme [Stagonosporopsis vannaccii]
MSSHTEDEWTVLNPTILSEVSMETNHERPSKAEAPPREYAINTKSDTDTKKVLDDCTCEIKPLLVRKDSIESIDDDYRPPRRAGRVPFPPPPPPHRRYSPSPQRFYPSIVPLSYQDPFVNSSTQLLEKVGKEDGIVELPAPAVRNAYLTTYPFGDKDVKKWAWLLASGVEDEYVTQSTRDANGDMPNVERIHQNRGEFHHIHNPGAVELPSVHLSRALDLEIVPEDSKHSLRYLIVTQNCRRAQGWKLLVAESRKAAGILIYYEMLKVPYKTMANLNDAQRAFLDSLPNFDPTNTSTHSASCHCGSIQYTVTLSPPLPHQKIGSCNCTICLKNGYLLLYPRREDVVIHQGEEALKSHSFGQKQLLHRFCGGCGSSVWHDPRLRTLGEEMPDLLGVNVRMFKGVKLGELDITAFDGYSTYPFIGDSEHLKEANTP